MHKVEGGWLEVIAGGMFCGKTEKLIWLVTRAQIAKQRVQVFKPAIDTRYGNTAEIVSHSGSRIEANIVHNSAEILEILKKLGVRVDVVAVDEAQFFDMGLISVCRTLVKAGIRVIVAGLNADFKCDPFGPTPTLMAIADHVYTPHAICVVCGGLASRTQRLINGQPAHRNDPVILVGGKAEGYEARCPSCQVIRED